MALRYYQTEFVDAVVDHYRRGRTSLLGVMSTGTGKSVTTAAIPDAIGMKGGEKLLLFVHRDQLVMQNYEKMIAANPGRKVGIEKAEYEADPDCDIIVASVQTIGRFKGDIKGDIQYSPRLTKFPAESIRYVINDEVHHAISNSYKAVLRYCGVLKGSPERDPTKLLLGVTATPNRHDKIGLECLFDDIAYQKPLIDFIEEKWLADIKAYRVQTPANIAHVKKSGEDLNITELSDALNTPERNALVVKAYKERGEDLPFLCFTVDVRHSHDISETFRANGIECQSVSGQTSEPERERIFELFRTGQIRGLASCAVLNEGSDFPWACVGLMARPTRSQLWYTQAVGRLFRPFPSPEDRATHTGWVKPHGIVIDFVDITGKHSIWSVPTLFGLRHDFDCKGQSCLGSMKRVEELQAKQKTIDLKSFRSIDEIESTITRIDLFKRPVVSEVVKRYSDHAWVDREGVYVMNLMDGSSLEIALTPDGMREVSMSRNGFKYPNSSWPNIALAFKAADKLVPRQDAVLHGNNLKWRAEKPTYNQCKLLFILDTQVNQTYRRADAFFQFAMDQFNGGNQTFSKGGLSEMIDKVSASDTGFQRHQQHREVMSKKERFWKFGIRKKAKQ